MVGDAKFRGGDRASTWPGPSTAPTWPVPNCTQLYPGNQAAGICMRGDYSDVWRFWARVNPINIWRF